MMRITIALFESLNLILAFRKRQVPTKIFYGLAAVSWNPSADDNLAKNIITFCLHA